MRNMEIRRENGIITIFDGDIAIEAYELDKEIDFSKLVSHLIKCDFVSKIDLVDKIDNKTDQEINLFNFIKRIVDGYNNKVDKYISTKTDDNIKEE